MHRLLLFEKFNCDRFDLCCGLVEELAGRVGLPTQGFETGLALALRSEIMGSKI